jgi:hypothetical protein
LFIGNDICQEIIFFFLNNQHFESTLQGIEAEILPEFHRVFVGRIAPHEGYLSLWKSRIGKGIDISDVRQSLERPCMSVIEE